MKALAIVIEGDPVSEQGFEALVNSSNVVGNEFPITRFQATTVDNVIPQFKKLRVDWAWPWLGTQPCFKTGLTMSAYETREPQKRVACFMSHYRLWLTCVEQDDTILVLEHDALFQEQLPAEFDHMGFNIIGINDPRGATRKSREFFNTVTHIEAAIQPVPRVDGWNIPQGLAGNSAYIITPQGAKDLISKVNEIGAWPNDALMCYQNIDKLGVSKTFYTRVQGLPSTTTQ
jgi:GR25 family glycosyltransferase involved in LPS biosynthesis|tara:strand:+ start:2607 stop:3299 length:693 start_codon:yes stop_codon:yes gene_type:complete